MVRQAIVRVVVGDPPTLNNTTPDLFPQPTLSNSHNEVPMTMTTQIEPTLANSLQDYLGFARMRGLDAKATETTDAYATMMTTLGNFYSPEKVELGKIASTSYLRNYNPMDQHGAPAFPAYLMQVEGLPGAAPFERDDEDEDDEQEASYCDGNTEECGCHCGDADCDEGILSDLCISDSFNEYCNWHSLDRQDEASMDKFEAALRAELEKEIEFLRTGNLRAEIVRIHETLQALRATAQNNGLWFAANFGLGYTASPRELLFGLRAQLDISCRHINRRIVSDMDRPDFTDQSWHIEVAKGLEDLRRKVVSLIGD